MDMSHRCLEEFVEITRDFGRALRSNDAWAIGGFLSRDWVLVTPEAGPVARQQFLQAVEEGILRHDTMEIEVVRVKVYGDTAIVTGRGRNTGTFKGHPIQADEWTTDIYRRIEGQWRCVLTQLTPASRNQASGCSCQQVSITKTSHAP